MRFNPPKSPGKAALKIVVLLVIGVISGASIAITILGYMDIGAGLKCNGHKCPPGKDLFAVAHLLLVLCAGPTLLIMSIYFAKMGVRLSWLTSLGVAMIGGGFAGHALWLNVHG